jgi:hypothetical protein
MSPGRSRARSAASCSGVTNPACARGSRIFVSPINTDTDELARCQPP